LPLVKNSSPVKDPSSLPFFLSGVASGTRWAYLATGSHPRRLPELPPRMPERRPSCHRRCSPLPPLLLRLWSSSNHPCAVSIVSPSFLISGTCRSTGARTPASPAPPPFSAGRSGCTSHPLEPLDVCAFASATRRAHTRTKWCPTVWSRVAPANPPPRAAALWRVRRHPACTRPGPCDLWWTNRIAYLFKLWGRSTVDSWATTTARSMASSAAGSKIYGSDRIQPQVKLEFTGQPWQIWLRAPGFLCICMSVLPPIWILANESWILWSSPCLLCLIALEVLFICFSMLAH
jgi:hypothetical protein